MESLQHRNCKIKLVNTASQCLSSNTTNTTALILTACSAALEEQTLQTEGFYINATTHFENVFAALQPRKKILFSCYIKYYYHYTAISQLPICKLTWKCRRKTSHSYHENGQEGKPATGLP